MPLPPLSGAMLQFQGFRDALITNTPCATTAAPRCVLLYQGENASIWIWDHANGHQRGLVGGGDTEPGVHSREWAEST